MFWRKWNENLNHLAKQQLQLLLEETQNHIRVLTITLNNQLENLRSSVDNHSTFTSLSDLIENMAINLRNNLILTRTNKLKRMLPTDTGQDTSNQPAINNPSSIDNRDHIANNITTEHNATTATPDFPNRNTTNTAPATSTSIRRKKKNRRTHSQNNTSQPLVDAETVINLSSAQLSNSETKLLSRGLSFVPTPKRINWSELQPDINDFARRLQLREFFQQKNLTDSTNPPDDEQTRFRRKGSWTPPNGRDAALDTFINAIETNIMTSKPTAINNNLSRKERKALTDLRKRSDIVIKPADKDSGTVVMDNVHLVCQ